MRENEIEKRKKIKKYEMFSKGLILDFLKKTKEKTQVIIKLGK